MRLSPILVEHTDELLKLIREAHARSWHGDRTRLNERGIREIVRQLAPAARQGQAFMWAGFEDKRMLGALVAARGFVPGAFDVMVSDLFFYSKRPGLGRLLLRRYADWGRRQKVSMVVLRTSFSTDPEYHKAMYRMLTQAGFFKYGENFCLEVN